MEGKHMTNGDYIRSMDNHNLAGMLAGYFATTGELEKFIHTDCHGKCPEDYQGDCSECVRTIQNWLDAERKEP